MACHHALAEALHAYIAVAGIAADKKAFLFRTCEWRSKVMQNMATRPWGRIPAKPTSSRARRGRCA
jgi:hypothetical protein